MDTQPYGFFSPISPPGGDTDSLAPWAVGKDSRRESMLVLPMIVPSAFISFHRSCSRHCLSDQLGLYGTQTGLKYTNVESGMVI